MRSLVNGINQFLEIHAHNIVALLLILLILISLLLIKSLNTSRKKNLKLKKIKISQNKIRKDVRSLLSRIEIKIEDNSNLKKKKRSELKATKSDQDKEIRILSRELTQWKKRVRPLVDRHKASVEENKKLKKQLLETQRIISTLEIMNSPNKSKTVIDLNNYRSRDNLQKIRGIGPSIEKILNKYDIYRYEQIANISEYEIETVARDIKGLKSQIHREDWIGQAEYLINKKVSEINQTD